MPTPVPLWGTTRQVMGPDQTEGYEVEGSTLLQMLTKGVDGLSIRPGTVVIPKASSTSTTLAGGATMTPTHPLHKVQGSGGPVTIGGIAAGSTDGQMLCLRGDHASNFVTLQSDGANVIIQSDITLRQNDIIALRWDSVSAKWVEESRSAFSRLTNRGSLDLFESRANGSNKISLRAPTSLAGDLIFNLPSVNASGTLSNDGSGNLTWQAGSSAEQNIVAYGAVDGADSTTAIVAAYNALPSTGGTIRVPRGTYLLQYSALFVWKSNVRILFDAGGALKGVAATNPGPLINVGDASHHVERFEISGGEIDGNAAACTLSANAHGHAVSFLNVRRVVVRNMYIHHMPGDGVLSDYNIEGNLNFELWITDNAINTCYRNSVSVVGGRRIFILDNLFDGFNTVGVDIERNNLGETIRDIQIVGNFLFPNATWLNTNNTNRQQAIALYNPAAAEDQASNAYVGRNFIFAATDGVIQYPTRGIKVANFRNFTLEGNHIFQTSDGIQAASGSSEAGSNGKISLNHVYGCSSIGIEAYYCVSLVGNLCEYNGGAGISIFGKKCSVLANICRNNGQNAALAFRYGIWLRDTCSEATLVGNLLFDDQGSKTQQYGLRLESGVAKCRIFGNDLYPNAAGQISDGSGQVNNDIFLNRGAPSVITNTEFTQDVLRLYQGVLATACLKLEPAADSAKGLLINKAGVGAGGLIELTNAGTGNDVTGNAGNWSISKLGALIAASAALSGAVSAASATISGAASVGSLTSSGALSATTGAFSGDITAAGGFRQSISYTRSVPGDGSAHDAWFKTEGLVDGKYQNYFLCTRPGSILRVSIASSQARTAGQITATVTVNGSEVALASTLDSGHTTYNDNGVAKDTIAVVAGDRIGVHIQHSSFTPSGSDIIVTVEVEG
jgi:hypothetical protein